MTLPDEPEGTHEPSRRRTAVRPTTEARFEIGDVFKPDDRVGHLVLGLGAAMNDLLLQNTLLMPPDDPYREDLTEPERLAVLRTILGLIWEVHLLIQAADQHDDVRHFLDEVAASYPSGRQHTGAELLAFLRGEGAVTAPAWRNLLRLGRNSTFHYPKPGSTDMVNALAQVSDRTSRFVWGERMPSMRAEFADDVLLFGLILPDHADQTLVSDLFADAAQTIVAIVHLAQIAIDNFLARFDVGVRSLEQTPPT